MLWAEADKREGDKCDTRLATYTAAPHAIIREDRVDQVRTRNLPVQPPAPAMMAGAMHRMMPAYNRPVRLPYPASCMKTLVREG